MPGSRTVASVKAAPRRSKGAAVRKPKSANPQVRIITAQIAKLEENLAKLRSSLDELLGKANKKEEKKESKSSSSDSKPEKKRDLTSKQKNDAAKRAKEHYEKNEKPEVEQREEIRAKIRDTEIKLKKMRSDLAKITGRRGSSTSIHKTPDKAGRPPGHPNYGDDPS